ncbi:MAG: purine-binding chemotaxis protein CheW [Myxococcales bacterium]|nr:purine-binding chemotaxis protein CheW [Myxococcales bacterium]
MEAIEHVAEHRSQYLTFEVCQEIYAIAILDLREIITFESATRIPMAPEAIRGLINLRGSAVPVIDLAIKFGKTQTPVSKRTCVIVLDSSSLNERGLIGILADQVCEVIELSKAEIEDAPDFGASVTSDYLKGLARVFDKFVPILDVDRLLSLEESAITHDSPSEIELEPKSDSEPAESPEDTAEKESKPRRSSKKKSKS